MSPQNEWFAGFSYPPGEWLPLEVQEAEGAARAARQIADRGGEQDPLYAQAVYPELTAIRDHMRQRGAGPVAVCVPSYPLAERPLVPVSVSVIRHQAPPDERATEAVAGTFRLPRPDRLGQPDIRDVELPSGPACRVHELLLQEVGDDGRQLVVEHIDWFVLPSACPDGVFQLSVTWSSPAIGPEMVLTAETFAASLWVRPVVTEESEK